MRARASAGTPSTVRGGTVVVAGAVVGTAADVSGATEGRVGWGEGAVVATGAGVEQAARRSIVTLSTAAVRFTFDSRS